MAGKRKKKSLSNRCNLSSQIDSTVTEEESMNQSLSDNREANQQFTVLLDLKKTYAKLLKSANIILVHPSVIKSLAAPRYVLVRGKNTQVLCVAYHLKDIKRSTVVFQNSIEGFRHEELVTLHPYTKPIFQATNVTVNFNTQITMDEDLNAQVLNVLRLKNYFYSGMTIKQRSFECVITNIARKECDSICGNDSLDVSGFKKHSTNFQNTIDISANETFDKEPLTLATQERSIIHPSSSQLQSMFSSMCLNDNEFQDSKFSTEENVSDIKMDSEESTPEFYTLTPTTSVSILGHTFDHEICRTCFAQIGGLKEELKCIRNFIDGFLTSKNMLYKLGILLLVGPAGTGKTLTLNAIRDEYSVHIEEILWYKLYLMTSSDAEQQLQQIFQRANKKAPCIILVDNFNYLCPKVKNVQSQRISRVLAYLIENCVNNNIVIVATSNNSEYDAEVLRARDTRVEEIKFRIPTTEERNDIFEKLLSTRQHKLTDEDIKQCVTQSQGFTGSDLDCVLNDAMVFQYMRTLEKKSLIYDSSHDTIIFEDIKQALKYKKPSIIQSNMNIKKVTWNDIGGMKEVKEKLKDIIEGPLKYPEIYRRVGITPSRGILLFGPPGCSKTMIAKAIATECDLNFISKNVSDIQNKYVGESEKAVRNMFLMAREKAPCIIFLDEIDALVAERGSSSCSGVEERIVNSFLQEMDGLEELRNVIVIAATNRPDRLDAGFMRNGRISHFIYIPLPDIDAREEILKLQMKNRIVAEDFDYKYLALKTAGYSGAEIVNICKEATLQISEEYVECSSLIFSLRHFENVMKSVIPRTSAELLDFYKCYNAKFGS